jgi:hypothetical protein
MNTGKPTTDSTEILNRIDRFTYDADWTIEELREALSSQGINPDLALETIKSKLAPLYQFKEPPMAFPGIVAAAEKIGFSLQQFGDATGFGDIFLLKLDRRLISLKGRSRSIATLLAEKLHSAVEPIQEYILGQSLYPAEANFKADAQPEIPDKQDFEEAVNSDPIMREETKELLLSLQDETE